MSVFKINKKRIGEKFEPYVIAEAGINHNGDINLAKKMIISAKRAGVDAVKFQTFQASEFVRDETTTYTYKSQGKIITESMLQMFKRNEFTAEEWKEIKDYCDDQEITFLSTPQNISDLELLLSIGIPAIKIGSDDFVNIPLVRRYAFEQVPLLLSCGMAEKSEIDRTLKVVKECGNNEVALLLCTSQYPTPPSDVNISKLITMGKEYPDIVLGFSDHTQGAEAAVMALAYGARVFEKHFTLGHNLPGPDHWFSDDPDELKRWVDSIRLSYQMLGSSALKPTESEMEMRRLAHRSITALKDIPAGKVFDEDNLGMRRPGNGLPASDWDSILGKKAKRDIVYGQQISMEDVDG